MIVFIIRSPGHTHILLTIIINIIVFDMIRNLMLLHVHKESYFNAIIIIQSYRHDEMSQTCLHKATDTLRCLRYVHSDTLIYKRISSLLRSSLITVDSEL